MVLTQPFWFKMRQGKAESAGDNVFKLTAPNLPETFVAVRGDGAAGWTPLVRSSPDGPEVVTGEKTYDNLPDAWNAAFELYRNAVVV